MSGEASRVVLRFALVVAAWDGERWLLMHRRAGLTSREQAELLGREEVGRVLFRTPWRKVAFEVSEVEEIESKVGRLMPLAPRVVEGSRV